ncbi:MAG: SDR family oxidoreductase [Planctomycetota bacterium]|nr:SDR family oxidoreductase [Planctomycetota bacterium]
MPRNETKNEPNVLELFGLRGRVAVVTGAGGHLGNALARALAEAGARVVATSRDPKRAAETAQSLPDSNGIEHFGAALDQTDVDSVDQFFNTVLRKTKHIDILVNNAHEHVMGDWQSISAEDFQHHFANITGYFLLARRVRDHAVERGIPASIVMLGSMYGVVGSYPDAYQGIGPASNVAYHALKGGIVHLTRHLAVYWAKDRVRVNCLSPGPFPSSAANPQLVERLTAKSPMGRMGYPHELKGGLLLFASDAGSYITGQNLIVDGGWTAW